MSRRRALGILFASYLALLVWVVVWKLEAPHVGSGALRLVKLVPFAATDEAGGSAPQEVLANLLLFVPFGVYLGLVFPAMRGIAVVAVAAGTSLVLELTQFVLAVGSSDATDIIVNAAGSAIGLLVLAGLRRTLGERTERVMVRACALGTVMVVILACAFALSPLRYAQHNAPAMPLASTTG